MLAPQDQAYQEQPVFTVTALARQARLLIEETFGFVQVEGELSGLRRPGSGHWYFTLKDDSAQLRCAMFAGRNRRVAFEPRDGQQVLLRGRLSLYEARGDFQLIADQMEPAGEGALRQAFEALKRSLAAEGLFDDARKRPLPELPRHLTVISSTSGAALRDVLQVVARRFPALAVTVIPTLVQGEGAEGGLLAALERAGTLATDVVLVTRGGGSLEDLQSFNLESVARAIAACPHPVVSAVGHQTDFTISDFVADLRAPTPSAGAELITPSAEELQSYLARDHARLLRAQRAVLRHAGHDLALLRSRLKDPRRQLEAQMQRADELEARLRRAHAARAALAQAQLDHLRGRLKLQAPGRRLPALRGELHRAVSALEQAVRARLGRDELTLAAKVRALQAVSPLNTLARGYAVLTRAGSPVSSTEDLNVGEQLTAFLDDGAVDVHVDDVRPGAQLTPKL